MEIFKIDLNPLQKQNKYQPYLSLIAGIGYIVIGIVKILNYDNSTFIDWSWIIGGVLFLIFGYFQKKYGSNYFIELNDKFIHLKDSLKKAKTIKWDNIQEIHIKPIALEFNLKDNSKKSLSLGNVSYKNVLDFKEKLSEYATNKGIALN